MKKVIVCKPEPMPVVETVCHTELKSYKMIVAYNTVFDGDWYLLVHEDDWVWKNMNNSNSRFCSSVLSLDKAVEEMIAYGGKVYSFNNLDEFIQFYQEEK